MTALILLVVALLAIFVWRKLGYWTQPTEQQIREANAGDGALIMTTVDHRDDHHPGDGHDHGGDAGNSGAGDSGGGSDGAADGSD